MGQRRGLDVAFDGLIVWSEGGIVSGTTHVFSRGELLEVPHGRLHLVLVVADRRGGSAGDAAERRRIRRSRPGRRHLAVGWVGTACSSNVYFLCREWRALFTVATIYLGTEW